MGPVFTPPPPNIDLAGAGLAGLEGAALPAVPPAAAAAASLSQGVQALIPLAEGLFAATLLVGVYVKMFENIFGSK